MNIKAFFFDMDGVIFNSMPNHAIAWEEVMKRYGLDFTARDTYINEGRTGKDVIKECYIKAQKQLPPDDVIMKIYKEKADRFAQMGETQPIEGIKDVLNELKNKSVERWVVTGSGQKSLLNKLENDFPNIFSENKMITAFDVVNGKPNPEPYLKAWQKSGYQKSECIVVENAPLGVRAGKAAGITTIAVNTGILTRDDLLKEYADFVFDDMWQLLSWIKQNII